MENTTHLGPGAALGRASRRPGTPPSRPDQPSTAAAIRLNELLKRENVEQAFVGIPPMNVTRGLATQPSLAGS